MERRNVNNERDVEQLTRSERATVGKGKLAAIVSPNEYEARVSLESNVHEGSKDKSWGRNVAEVLTMEAWIFDYKIPEEAMAKVEANSVNAESIRQLVAGNVAGF